MQLAWHYDYLAVAVKELTRAVQLRDHALRPDYSNDVRLTLRRAMRHHALRSRRAFQGELLTAN